MVEGSEEVVLGRAVVEEGLVRAESAAKRDIWPANVRTNQLVGDLEAMASAESANRSVWFVKIGSS